MERAIVSSSECSSASAPEVREFILISSEPLSYETAIRHQRKLGYTSEPRGFLVKKNHSGLYVAKWSAEQ